MLTRQFTEEQVMFREAYRRFLAKVVPHMERFREQAWWIARFLKRPVSRAFSWCGQRSATRHG